MAVGGCTRRSGWLAGLGTALAGMQQEGEGRGQRADELGARRGSSLRGRTAALERRSRGAREDEVEAGVHGEEEGTGAGR